MTERNPIWVPIDPPRPRALWASVDEMYAAYRDDPPVRISRSQRYSLTLTEPRS